ncbi:MAG TPA: ABC transporter ATP-binding protein [Ilumatobacter sp.]|nr:ABC transporter ATP-binding protein [Ilumatobacter sp.]
MSALVFAGVSKSFGPTIALELLDLEVTDGELITLLGPSGCGKTTALRIAAGFEFADAGTVAIGGSDLTRVPAHRRNIGMVFQSYSLFPNLTAVENVEFGLRTRKIDKVERRRRAGEMLELVQLSQFADRYAHQMSGGQQQRVALARALAIQPKVLLLDEPLSALDAKVRLQLRDEIRRIQTELGITTLMVTHDQEEALGIADRVGVMSNGRLEQVGAPSDVYSHPSSAFVARFVGSMNEFPAEVVDGTHVTVHGVAVPTAAAATGAAGSTATLLVRPEDVGVEGTGDGPTGLVGSVVATTFQGATTVVSVRLDVLDLLVSANLASSKTDHLHPGQRAAITIDGTRAVLEP